MDITYQHHENHCGICVINSLTKYYFKNSNFNQILTDANLTSYGLSIFEFEALCFKYGILAETYETNIIELEKLNISDYFVLVIFNNNNNHFVIAKRVNKGIKIYDSAKGEYILSFEELAKVFANIFIKISKIKSNKLTKLNSKKWINYLDVKLFLLFTLINILIASLSICFGLFMNYVLDLCVISQNVKNLVIVCFSFAIISSLKHLFNYLLTYLNSRQLKEQYYFYKSKLFDNLFNKKNGFFNKVNKNNFFILNNAMITICNFNIIVIPNLVSNILIGLVCLCILISNSIYFLILFIVIILFQIFYSIINLNFQKRSLENNIKNASSISIYSNQYIQNKKCNNCYINEKLKEGLNNEFNVSLRNNSFQSIISSKLSLIFNLFNDLLFIITSFASIVMIWKNNNFSIGEILFIINTQLILSSSVSEMSNFFGQRFIYKKMRVIYDEFCEIDNITNKSTRVIEKINTIKEIKAKKITSLMNGKTYHRDNFSELTDSLLNHRQLENYSVKINDFDTIKINQNWLNTTICYFNNKNKLKKKKFDYDSISNKAILNCIKKFNIKIENPKDINEIIMLNVLKLFESKNKIIIFDKYFNNLTLEYKKYINNCIIKEIVKNNFVLINE